MNNLQSIAPIKKVFSIFQSVYFMFFASANSAKNPFLIVPIPHSLSAIPLFPSECRIKWSTCELCETQWPRPPLFSPSLLIQLSMRQGSYITLFSPSDVTAFHKMKYGGWGYYTTLFSPSDVTAFHRFLWNAVTSSETLLNGYSVKTMSYNTPPIL